MKRRNKNLDMYKIAWLYFIIMLEVSKFYMGDNSTSPFFKFF